jgi:glutaredoxin
MLSQDTVIEINSKDDCKYCIEAKAWLSEMRIPYTEILHNDKAERQAFYDSLGLQGSDRTMPQVFLVTGQDRFRIGGSDDLKDSGIA